MVALRRQSRQYCSTFCGSNGWLDRFKRRHCIKLKIIKGEANSVDIATVDEFRAGVATSLPQRYDPEDIFNADETALFWLITARKTLTFKHDPCVGAKRQTTLHQFFAPRE